MSKILRAKTDEELDEILKVLRGRFFELDSVGSELDSETVSIETSVLGDDHQDVLRAILNVHSGIDVNVIDQAKTGESDFNEMSYSENVLEIKGSVPVEVKIRVHSLDVELEISDEVLRRVSKFRSSFLRS